MYKQFNDVNLTTAEICFESFLFLFLYNFHFYSLILSALLFQSAFGMRHSLPFAMHCIPSKTEETKKYREKKELDPQTASKKNNI